MKEKARRKAAAEPAGMCYYRLRYPSAGTRPVEKFSPELPMQACCESGEKSDIAIVFWVRLPVVDGDPFLAICAFFQAGFRYPFGT